MKRLLAMAVALSLVVAACGGGSGDDATENGGDQPNPTQAPATQPAADDGGSDETAPPAGDGGDDTSDSEGSGPSTATVTLGDQTYNFSTEGAVVAQCLTDLFGIFSIQLPMVDGDGGVAIVVLHEGTDPNVVGEVNSVEVSVGDEDWKADEAHTEFDQSGGLKAGMSQVDSVEIDGRTVRGTATFVRQLSLFSEGEVETVTGTFEATCGEKRLS